MDKQPDLIEYVFFSMKDEEWKVELMRKLQTSNMFEEFSEIICDKAKNKKIDPKLIVENSFVDTLAPKYRIKGRKVIKQLLKQSLTVDDDGVVVFSDGVKGDYFKNYLDFILGISISKPKYLDKLGGYGGWIN